MDVYMGLFDEPTDLVTPTAEQTRELHQHGFTTHIEPTGWTARCTSGRFRIQITPCARGWRVTRVRVTDGQRQSQVRGDLSQAIALATKTEDVADLADALGGLITAQLRNAS